MLKIIFLSTLIGTLITFGLATNSMSSELALDTVIFFSKPGFYTMEAIYRHFSGLIEFGDGFTALLVMLISAWFAICLLIVLLSAALLHFMGRKREVKE